MQHCFARTRPATAGTVEAEVAVLASMLLSRRSAALCVRMNNVTMVIPTEREVNYHIFMYTMHNSPAPSLRALASFMRTDLGFKQLEVSLWAAFGGV